VELLKIPNASMVHFLKETTRFSTKDNIKFMAAILVEIERCLEKDETYMYHLKTVARNKILPVTDAATESFGITFERLLAPRSKLFIADTVPLRNNFVGLVPLLAFGIDDSSKMKQFINQLGIDNKRLSRAAKSIPRTAGKVDHDRNLTD
jgi:hypothetical protein